MKKVQDAKTAEQTAASEDRRSIRARQRALGRELRRFYDDVAQEPIPEDFLDLLHRIAGTEADGGEGSETS